MIRVNPCFHERCRTFEIGIDPIAHPISKELEHTMANALQPSGRTTPVPAYIALRDNGPFGNSNRTRGVSANNPAGPRNTMGVGSAKLGGPNGVTLQNNGHL